MMRRILLLLCLSGLVVHLPAEDSISLRVGIYQNNPKIYADEKDEAAGIYVELLNEIARQEGWHIEYVHGSWLNCIQWLEEGKIDLLPDVAFTLERAAAYRFNTIPVLESWSQVYARPPLHIGRLFDLENKRVTLLKGSVQEIEFQNLMSGFGLPYTHIALTTFEEAFNWVQKDLADAVIANYYFGEAHYAAYGLVRTPVIIHPTSLYFALHPDLNPCILQTLDNYLEEWKASPHSLYYETLKSYLNPVPDSSQDHNHLIFFLIIAGLGAVLAIALILLVKSRRQRKASESEARDERMKEAEKFRNYIEHAPVGVFVVNEQGRFIEVNREACRSTGYAEAELLQKDMIELLTDEARMEGIRHFQRVVAEGKASGIFGLITKHSGKRFFSVEAVRISGERFLGFVTDVSETILRDEEKQHRREILKQEVEEKTKELSQRIAELEQFQEATIERELRMEELRQENERWRKEVEKLKQQGKE